MGLEPIKKEQQSNEDPLIHAFTEQGVDMARRKTKVKRSFDP